MTSPQPALPPISSDFNSSTLSCDTLAHFLDAHGLPARLQQPLRRLLRQSDILDRNGDFDFRDRFHHWWTARATVLPNQAGIMELKSCRSGTRISCLISYVYFISVRCVILTETSKAGVLSISLICKVARAAVRWLGSQNVFFVPLCSFHTR